MSKAVEGTPGTKVSLACDTDAVAQTSPPTPPIRGQPAATRSWEGPGADSRVQTNPVSSYFALLSFANFACFTNRRQHPKCVRGIPVSVGLGRQDKDHRLGGLNDRNLFPHSPGGWKSELRVPAGWASPEAPSSACALLSSSSPSHALPSVCLSPEPLFL